MIARGSELYVTSCVEETRSVHKSNKEGRQGLPECRTGGLQSQYTSWGNCLWYQSDI